MAAASNPVSVSYTPDNRMVIVDDQGHIWVQVVEYLNGHNVAMNRFEEFVPRFAPVVS